MLTFFHPGRDAAHPVGRVPYRDALDLQRSVHADVVAGKRGNTVLLLEHPPVYTAGKQAAPEEYPTDGTEVVPTGRGGKVTYHGPGMLIGYPILRLPVPIDPVGVVRELENLLLAVAARVGVQAITVPGRSGAWVPADDAGPARKFAAIGLQVSRRTTLHGFALNCDNDLAPFEQFVPCGIRDAGVTTLTREAGRPLTPADVLPLVEEELRLREPALCRTLGTTTVETTTSPSDLTLTPGGTRS